MTRAVTASLILAALLLPACTTRPGAELPRRGDEIMVCGRLFHTGAPVVLWTDPGGYDGYRTEKRFAPWSKSAFQAPAKPADGPASPNRYGTRFVPPSEPSGVSRRSAASASPDTPSADTALPTSDIPHPTSPLSPDDFERIRGGGWDLPLLQSRVDQFVLHYDAAGASRQCFHILHDIRGLSVHFMLDIDGTIYQTLDLKERAWHATTANDRSIGIEIANIGAYPPSEPSGASRRSEPAPTSANRPPDPPDILTTWYTTDNRGTRITLPPSLGDGGIRTPNFIGRPARPNPILGEIQGRELLQYDFTPQQYASLIKLTAALHRVLPRINLDYPRDDHDQLITHTLPKDQLAAFRGILGHYHIQDNKSDPGPALQWDRLINSARRLDRLPPLPPGQPGENPHNQRQTD